MIKKMLLRYITAIPDYIKTKYNNWKRERRLKAKIKELRKKDPFIYKH